jgi:Kef-type K+ transport system membrane component KefB
LKYRLYLALLLSPAIFLPLVWLYPSSIVFFSGHEPPSIGFLIAYGFAFVSAYSFVLFLQAFVQKNGVFHE